MTHNPTPTTTNRPGILFTCSYCGKRKLDAARCKNCGAVRSKIGISAHGGYGIREDYAAKASKGGGK